MAFGIDDALMAAAAGISLTRTVVETSKAYRKKRDVLDIERLIDEVRVTALQRLDEADLCLVQLERILNEKNGLDMTLQGAIRKVPMWRPDEAHRLKRIKRGFDALSEATYSASDDIASLVRCRGQSEAMGVAVVEAAAMKHEFHERLIAAGSIRESIQILRTELTRQKGELHQ